MYNKSNNNIDESQEVISSLIECVITEKTIDLEEKTELQNENNINEEANKDPGFFLFLLYFK